jgi:DNA-binding XRE family transcriptional regulator
MVTNKKVLQSKLKRTSKRAAETFFQKVTGGPLNIGRALYSLRMSDEISQAEFARKLNIPRQHLNDIEKGRRAVTLEKAVVYARVLGQPDVVFIQLALQTMVDEAGLKVTVKVAA